jgi:hypothetical protein
VTQLSKPLDLPWENDIPIDNEYVLLDLLYHMWGEKSDRVLWMPFENVNDKTPPYIEVGWYCGGYTKEEHSKARMIYKKQLRKEKARLKEQAGAAR